MNKLAIALPILTVLVLFVAFITLLIIGMATMSIGFIIGAFVVGFVGVAIVEHNAEAAKTSQTNQSDKTQRLQHEGV